jgi:outer membrane biosynthesis protein TonB
MRKIILIVTAVLATTSAHAELSGPTVAAAAAPAAQVAPAVVQPAPVAQPAPAPVQAAPVQSIIQTTNPQAQRVLKELQAHGLFKLQPQPAVQSAPAAPVNVMTAPAVNQTQTVQAPAVQPQAIQTQPVQAQPTQPHPVAAAVQQPATQSAAAPATSSVSVSKPVVHATTHRDADEAKARRIAARYGIHW